VARRLQSLEHVAEARAPILIDHDAQARIEPRMREIDPLGPIARDGEIGNRDIDVNRRSSIDKIAERLQSDVIGLQSERLRKHFPELDRHTGIASVFLHDERRAKVHSRFHESGRN